MVKKFDPIEDLGQVVQTVNQRKRKRPQGFGPGAAKDSLAATVRIIDSAPESKSDNAEQSDDKAADDKAANEDTQATDDSQPEGGDRADAAANESNVTQSDIAAAIRAALSPLQEQVSTLQQRLEDGNETNAELQSQLEAAKAELEAAKRNLSQKDQDSSALKDLLKLAGNKNGSVEMPMVNTKTNPRKESPDGLAGELVQMLEDDQLCKANRYVRAYSPATGRITATQRNPQPIAQFINAHFREQRRAGRDWRDSQLVQDVERWLKNQGLLSGSNAPGQFLEAQAGATTGGSGAAPNAFLDVLSAIMRETHNQHNVFWQFASTVFDPSSEPGKNILVPRFEYLTEPTDPADFVIANNDTFNPIAWNTGSSSDAQALEMTTVPVACTQYGLGRGTAIGTRPVFIPEFHQATSLVNLLDALDTRLMQNYYSFEDLLIKLRYQATTVVAYNDGGVVTNTAGDVDDSDRGTMTQAFLNAVYSDMYAAKIPSYPDGCYALVLNPRAANQLKTDLGDQWRPATDEQIQSVSSTFRSASGVEIGRVSGYMGMYCNFHVFVTNSFGIGAHDGAVHGGVSVHQEDLGGSNTDVTLRDSYAFGRGAVGRGIALPMEIRSMGSPFNLGEATIWVSREGVGDLDVDSGIAAAQQTRVWKLRTADAEI